MNKINDLRKKYLELRDKGLRDHEILLELIKDVEEIDKYVRRTWYVFFIYDRLFIQNSKNDFYCFEIIDNKLVKCEDWDGLYTLRFILEYECNPKYDYKKEIFCCDDIFFDFKDGEEDLCEEGYFWLGDD